MKFKNGNRIRMLKDFGGAKKGMVGTVVWDDVAEHPAALLAAILSGVCYEKAQPVGVEFDSKLDDGSDLAGMCKDGFGALIPKGYCEIVNEVKTKVGKHRYQIIIDIDNDGATANFFKNAKPIKSAEVKRYKKDVFSVSAAAKAALEKLFSKGV